MHTSQVLAAAATATFIAIAAPAYAGHNGDAVGAGLLGFGVGAVVGSALTPSTVVVAPPPAYAPAAYGPPPWSPAWYSYCQNLHGPYFNPNTGYFQAADGGWYFCR
jgi:hypothetical protein